MPADSSLSLHRNPIACGIRIAIVICGVLLAALLVDRIFFAADHLQVRLFDAAPATVALLTGAIPRHVQAAVPVDSGRSATRVAERAQSESRRAL